MKMYKSILLTACISVALISCGKGKSTENAGTKNDSTKVETPANKGPQKVELKWKDKGTDKNDVPHNDVILSIDGKDSVISSILTCDSIGKDEYTSKEIPAEATTACGGWYAGAGEYFYAYIKDGKVRVFYGWQAEEQEDEGFHWEEMDLKNPKKKTLY